MLSRVVVPSRLALIYRNSNTLGYNPSINLWHRLEEDSAEVLRWLRAKRNRSALKEYLVKRFDYSPVVAQDRLLAILKWCVLRGLLYLDRDPILPELKSPINPLSTIYWICTQACNLRCTYCYQSATVTRPNELSTREAKSLIDQAVEAGVTTFIFTGGEPFLRQDLLDIAHYSREKGLQTNIITNGTLITKDNINEIAEVFNRVTISLDHGIQKYHDCNRGQGSWNKAVDAIELLLGKNIELDINSVISKSSLKNIDELFKFVHARRIKEHRITPQFPMGRGVSNNNLEFSLKEIINVCNLINQAKFDLMEDEKTQTKIENYIDKGVRRNHCGAGLSEVAIDPEGWVYPCKILQHMSFRTQNIRDKHLVEIVENNPTLKLIRSKTVDQLRQCKTCIIKNHCGGGCRGIHFSFTQEYEKSDFLFCSYLRHSFELQAWGNTENVTTSKRQNKNILTDNDRMYVNHSQNKSKRGMRYFTHNPHIIWDIVDGEAILCDIKTGQFFSINSIGAYIWEICEEGCTFDQILGHMYKVYPNYNIRDLQFQVEQFILSLERKGLIV